ncbi:hypothetical protein E2C01_079533 [Portunus trituberculatus]|uniref:Uncharacterized protein n=1 Tax=Portunus trituberculatus TaxID=210409 RepID=A0A5B7IX47_PORTR|nr:hypothetical protein [Portunus trituberculatus]
MHVDICAARLSLTARALDGSMAHRRMRASPPTRKPLPRVRKPNLYSNSGQDSNLCAWRPLGPQSTHGSTVPRRLAIKSGNSPECFGLTRDAPVRMSHEPNPKEVKNEDSNRSP